MVVDWVARVVNAAISRIPVTESIIPVQIDIVVLNVAFVIEDLNRPERDAMENWEPLA